MAAKIKTIKGVNVTGKRVIFRVAYDFTLVKTKGGYKVPDDLRIAATLPTLRYLLKNKAKVVILTWLGRPKKKEAQFKLDPVARRLSQLIGRPVKKLDESVGPRVEAVVNAMQPGEIVMLENIRFYPGEKKANQRLAQQLARLGDIVVNDAFAQVHRKAASLAPLQKLVPSYAGFLLHDELTALRSIMDAPRSGRLAIIGGIKVSTRLKLIRRLERDFEHVLLGGALANTLFAAAGQAIGRSIVENDLIGLLQSERFLKRQQVVLPVDLVVATAAGRVRQRAVGAVKPDETIYDIGPDTQALYSQYIKAAKQIVWNGPLGKAEIKPFDRGTNVVARAMAASRGRSIVGGGDTIAEIMKLKLKNKFTFISTGGGAMLHYLEGSPLPGLQYLKKQR